MHIKGEKCSFKRWHKEGLREFVVESWQKLLLSPGPHSLLQLICASRSGCKIIPPKEISEAI